MPSVELPPPHAKQQDYAFLDALADAKVRHFLVLHFKSFIVEKAAPVSANGHANGHAHGSAMDATSGDDHKAFKEIVHSIASDALEVSATFRSTYHR